MTTSRYDQIMKSFSKRLRTARKKAGFTSAQKFANFAGLEPHTYRRYERGDAEPNFEALVRICEALGVTANDLIPVMSVGAPSKDQGSAKAA